MGLSVTFVSGVPRCGKTTLIRLLRQRVAGSPVYYLRLKCQADGADPPPKLADPIEKDAFAGCEWIAYERDRIFEILPDALAAIRRRDRHAQVVIEADADPHLRHAYPYDRRVFVMPPPRQLHDVFRTAAQAAHAFKEVLHDTTVFASEIFGLFADDDVPDTDGGSEERPELTASQMHNFLNSPLGDELASRIQLQPQFHGLTESDVVVINTPALPAEPVVSECVDRIRRLLTRVRTGSSHKTQLSVCNLLDDSDPARGDVIESLAALLRIER